MDYTNENHLDIDYPNDNNFDIDFIFEKWDVFQS